jgi:phosphatidylglycerol---prolipoprotein diacylglyceryl transferase
MHPILLQFGPFTLYSYGAFCTLGMLLGTLLIAWQLKWRVGTYDFLPSWILVLVLAGFLGARALNAFYHPQLFWASPLEFILSSGGLVLYGGFFAGIVAFYVLAQRSPYSLVTLADSFAPGVLLGVAFGRLGCFLAGCCYGTPCSIEALAVHYPSPHATLGMAMHAVQLYEAFGLLLLILWMLPVSKQRVWKGFNISLFFFGYGVLRFFMELLRGDKLLIDGQLSVSQWFSLLAVAIGLLLWMRSHREKNAYRLD